MTELLAPFYRQIDTLERSEVPDGYVIYDNERGQVHFLNLTAATVLELCNGRNTAASIAAILQHAFALQAPPQEEIETCLASLLAQHLIEAQDAASSP
jgi:Coenzyme PQQ synthesis protein D (PqqD)